MHRGARHFLMFLVDKGTEDPNITTSGLFK